MKDSEDWSEKAGEYKMSDEELKGYASYCDKSLAMQLLKRLRASTRKLPAVIAGSAAAIVTPLGHLISALENPDTPVGYKTIICGAIGYIVLPFDVLPDVVPVVGYADDIGITAAAVVMVKAFSTFSLEELDREIDREEQERTVR